MQYNTQRKKLAIPEYGRHIHQMIDYCKAIENSEKRNKHAQSIIDLMGIMNPHLRDIPDFQHKLWDQLFIMANFELDVQSPYPILSQEEIYKKPEQLNYPKNNSSHKYYGTIIRQMIEKASCVEDHEIKNSLIQTLANHMKKAYIRWNREQVEDEVIFQHLEEISEGKIKISEEITLLQNINSINNKKKSINQKKFKQNRKF